MRFALVLTAAALLAPAPVLSADAAGDPPVTFQIQPFDRLLADLRGAAELFGGAQAVKEFNDAIKEKLGDKGFEGLDLNRPIVGYVALAPALEDSVAVVALPVTGEEQFLALFRRWNGGTRAKDLGKGLYELPPLLPPLKARMRFADGYAYIASGKDPEPALGAKALIAPNKLLDPAERAAVAAKLHFDRVPAEAKKAVTTALTDLSEKLTGANLGPLGVQERVIVDGFGPGLAKSVARWVPLLGGADGLTLRLNVELPAGDLVTELVLTPKSATPLAKELAARKPTANRFAGLLAADTVAGFKTRLPFFTDELREGAAKALESAQKQLPPNGPQKDVLDELVKGLIRTVKTGEADLVAGVRGPDKGGAFAVVGAVAFDDPAALEKEFKKFIDNTAPPDEKERVKWDAGKAGAVNIHTYKLTPGGFFDVTKPFGGDKAVVAFAFAPTGVFFVLGADPIAVMKDALAVKPTASPVLDVVVNPARLEKFAVHTAGQPGQVEKVLGKEDKLISAASLGVITGKDLTVRLSYILRLLPRIATTGGPGPAAGPKRLEDN